MYNADIILKKTMKHNNLFVITVVVICDFCKLEIYKY